MQIQFLNTDAILNAVIVFDINSVECIKMDWSAVDSLKNVRTTRHGRHDVPGSRHGFNSGERFRRRRDTEPDKDQQNSNHT